MCTYIDAFLFELPNDYIFVLSSDEKCRTDPDMSQTVQ
jgi:hypothetical protein